MPALACHAHVLIEDTPGIVEGDVRGEIRDAGVDFGTMSECLLYGWHFHKALQAVLLWIFHMRKKLSAVTCIAACKLSGFSLQTHAWGHGLRIAKCSVCMPQRPFQLYLMRCTI